MTQPGVKQPPNHTDVGLTSEEARRRLEKFGVNAMPDMTLHPLRMALEKFWAPVPWMLEAAILLQIVLGKYVEASIIASLLVFNAVLGFFQEGHAQATLAALKSRLALTASVHRDGAWKEIPAAELAPGDVVKLSLGGVVAADARLTAGEVLLDQSMLTGESVPIEAGPGVQTYSGALVRRGEAVAEVTATGTRTKFGQTAELVRTAHVVSSQQKAVLRVVRNLAVFNGVVILALVAYAYFLKMPLAEIIPLVLTAVLASIPVALPATFTLASALGANALARVGVLPTRLSAVDEAAMMDVLCADKTGTLTRNELKVTTTHSMPGFDVAHVLAFAALASSDGGQDPVDAAIRAAAAASDNVSDAPKLISFASFDPAKKMSEATAADSTGNPLHIVKGAFDMVAALAPTSPTATAVATEFEKQGFRVLAVAAGPPSAMNLVGLIALSDPPNPDSAAFITELRELGVRTVMVTGDAPATAAIVAHAVGLDGAICPPGPIPEGVRPEAFAVFAGVLPEDKYKLVKAFQAGGHIVGMCGDGANDAPALRQAQIGIAVSTATDVAKSAAGVVLTEPGLAGIVASVKEGRITFERILSYTLNSITKKTVQVLFLGVGLIMTGHAILTPLLMVLIMIAGDFLGMSLTTDNVRPSSLPNAWRIGDLTIAGVAMGIGELVFCVSVLAFGAYRMGLDIHALRTLAFVVIVFGNQATLYTNRERRSLWSSRPSFWLIASSVADVSIASTLAVGGIAMTSLSFVVVAGALASAIAFAVVLDLIKVPIFRRLSLGSPISRHLLVADTAPAKRPTAAKRGIEIGTPRLRPILLLLGFAIAAGGAGYEFWDRFETTLPIGIVSANGRIEANELDITTKAPGRVADLLVDEGATVTAGQILAHIDTKDRDALRDRDAMRVSDLQKIIGEDEVLFDRASFQLRRAKQRLARARGLSREGHGTRKMLAQRQQEIYSATAALTAAKAKLGEDRLKLDVAKHAVEEDEANIADSAIVAPIAGRIQRQTAHAGEVLPLGAKVFVMLDTASIYIDILLPVAVAGKVKVGSDARVVLDALPNLSLPAKASVMANGARSGPMDAESKSQRKDPMVPVRVLIDPVHLGAAAAFVRSGMPGVVHIRLDP